VDGATGGVRRAVGEKGDSFLLAGAVADKAGFTAGSSAEPGRFPVAMSGRVAARVVGPIEIGDPITLSLTPGVGVKAEEASTIVGIALEKHEGPGPAVISLLVRPGWFNGTTIAVANTETSDIETEVPITDVVDFASKKLIGIGAMEGAGLLWSIDAEGKVVAKELAAEKIRVKRIEVEQTGDSQAAGDGVIPMGNSSVLVENPIVAYNSRIFVTFYGPTEGGWWISSRQDGKFEISLGKPAGTDLKFEYLVVGVVDNRPAPPPPAPEPDPNLSPPVTVTDGTEEAPEAEPESPEQQPTTEPGPEAVEDSGL
jgi:hypothetical protein